MHASGLPRPTGYSDTHPPNMVILNFTLSEEGVAVLHDALACMFKFSDDVCLEARKDKVPRDRHTGCMASPLTASPLEDWVLM